MVVVDCRSDEYVFHGEWVETGWSAVGIGIAGEHTRMGDSGIGIDCNCPPVPDRVVSTPRSYVYKYRNVYLSSSESSDTDSGISFIQSRSMLSAGMNLSVGFTQAQ